MVVNEFNDFEFFFLSDLAGRFEHLNIVLAFDNLILYLQ